MCGLSGRVKPVPLGNYLYTSNRSGWCPGFISIQVRLLLHTDYISSNIPIHLTTPIAPIYFHLLLFIDFVWELLSPSCCCVFQGEVWVYNMKFILKGKEFLSKKLQQLDLASQGMDLVSEQIPHRLRQPLAVLQNSQIDLDSNDKYETYFKSYPNHHISHYLQEKLTMALEADSPAPPYRTPSAPFEAFLPTGEKQLQRRALLLKEVVDEYDEGYHKAQEPLICMAVIHFHHKRGTEVQHRFPSSKAVEEIQNLLVHHAMPDSSHNKMEDYNFFNFEATWRGKRRMLFGVSYFKQIKVTEDMKANNSEITRSYLQKAIAVLSTLPLFGYLKLRLAPTTKAFFQDFNNHSLIDSAFRQLNRSLGESWPRMEMGQLYIGSDLRVIVGLFGAADFYQIWKAVLYQKRVVIFAHSSSSASSFIISLLTLFPGLSAFGLFSKPISRYMQTLREYALPLRTFSSQNFMAMSFHIQDFHLLGRFQKSTTGSFLIGTTNRLLKEANDYGIEMMINLENCTIEKRKPRVPWETLSKVERTFIGQLEETMKGGNQGWQDSEDIIRAKFHSFLKQQLVGIMKAAQSLRKWTASCQEYQRKNKRKSSKQKKRGEEYAVMADEEEEPGREESRGKEEFPPLIPPEVTTLPFPGLLLTRSFPYFLQFHNEKLPQLISGSSFPSLLIESHDYLYSLSRQEFVLYNWAENRISFGRGTPQNYQGKQIRFLQGEPLTARQVFVGQVQSGKYSKSGTFLDANQHYEGEFQSGCREGYGKLTNAVHKYIGNFRNNLYEGHGQLVTGKDIYVGQFRQGLRHGFGKNQGELNYDGQWQNGRPEGSGVLKIGQQEFIARFKKGIIDQSQEVTIRFQNGSMYKGQVKDNKPHGKGYLIDQQGTIFAEFKQGEKVGEIKDVSQEEEGQIKQLKEQSPPPPPQINDNVPSVKQQNEL